MTLQVELWRFPAASTSQTPTYVPPAVTLEAAGKRIFRLLCIHPMYLDIGIPITSIIDIAAGEKNKFT